MKRVDLHYRRDSTGPIESLLRATASLRELGWDLVDKKEAPIEPEKGKLIVTQQFYVDKKVLEGRSPLIVAERLDAAICWIRDLIEQPAVKKVIKLGILRPSLLQNCCRGRYHSVLLNPASLEAPTKVLSGAALKKLTPDVSYWGYKVMSRWIGREVDMDKSRDIGVHFVGTLNYGDRDEITEHRKKAIEITRHIKHKHFLRGGRRTPREEYDSTMLRSKIVLSPWGFGEDAH